MIKNYFKIALRNLFRYKWNSLFNILGLAIGLACFIYIFFLLRFELNYDGFHKDIERIYRIPMTLKVEGRITHYAAIPLKYGRYIKNNFEEIEKIARIKPWQPATFEYGDKKFIEDNYKYIEQDILDIFTFEFIGGSKHNALTRPFTAIINDHLAQKYFGNENPVGKLLKIDTAYFEITGVYKKLPKNSRLKPDAILSFVTGNPDQYDDMRAGGFLQTFIKIKEDIDPFQLEKKLKQVPEIVNKEQLEEGGEQNIIFLQALKDIHTDTTLEYTWDTEPITNPTYIYILFTTGIFILLIASLNFINLSTAKYTNRAKEVSIRKTIGANRKQLILQFLGESILIVFIAHILGMFLIELTINKFNTITQLDLNIDYLDFTIWAIIVGLILFIGIISGFYPAFLLSSFNPTGMQKNTSIKIKGGRLRKMLVVVQYTVTIVLIIGTVFIIKQVNFMINSPIGFTKDQKVIIELPRDLLTADSYQTVKQEFLKIPGVKANCISSSIPGRWRYKWRIWATGKDEQSKHIYCMQIDNDFFDVYNIHILKGEKYFNENSSDNDWMLNEAGIEIYDWSLDSALNQSLMGRHNIKAVVSNYHFEGLQKKIEPLAFFKIQEDFRYMTLQLESDNVALCLSKIEQKFKDLYPELVYNYFFLDQDFERQYESEKRIVKIFTIFTIIGLLIATIGIFGLAVFMCQQKEKEIGIRKVSGAGVWNIFRLLSLDFTKWILLSFIIAIPIVYWGINAWLKNFAYRIDISWLVILLCGLIIWSLAMLTVSYQTIKSARKNPIDSLRFE